jgi:RNA-binding protein
MISPSKKKQLKQLAHGLKPVIIIGQAGLTDAVHAEIAQSLQAHELLKIKHPPADAEERATYVNALCQTHQASLIQRVGRTITIYRPKT